jgi:AraC-like DNA-binding protein
MPAYSSREQAFLKRLTEITEANLTNNQFGVSELAREMGKSRSNIHIRLKALTGESVSQFIRRIRLEKGLELLRQDKLTAAEIAYEVGFGSPSYFTKCFHDHYGYPPGEYSKYASTNEIEIGKVLSDPVQSTAKNVFGNSISKKVLIPVLGFLILTVCVFYVYKTFIIPEQPKSIVVLSLKNLSNDEDIQHLAGGIMEDIRTRLSHLSTLEVKSQISSEKYSNTNLSANEIARELGVSYILEGSIIPDNGKIRINIQLISAKKMTTTGLKLSIGI